MFRRDLLIAPTFEALLIAIVALAGWLTHKPLVFTSLGPTAFELIEQPERPSARPYNVIMGHLIAVAAGFAALFITHAWGAPAVSSGSVAMPRVWAAVLSALLTVAGTLLARATQPAALSTTLLISLGSMQQSYDAAIIIGAVLLMTACGEPLRRWRVRSRAQHEAQDGSPS